VTPHRISVDDGFLAYLLGTPMLAKKRLRRTSPTVLVSVPRARAKPEGQHAQRVLSRFESNPRSNRRSPGPSAEAVDAPSEPATESKPAAKFDVQAFLKSTGLKSRLATYTRDGVVFRQGDSCDRVMYIQAGLVKISVVSKTGRQAVVAMLGPGDFFGVGGLAGQPVRMESATATRGTTILVVDQLEMARLLHEQHAMSDMLIAHLLMRTIRVEEDLIDQLFSSSEKRLARKLLMLARYKERDQSLRAVPAVSQETLAEMVGTTRSRINFFMKKFQRLGFIDYKNGLRVHDSLLTVVLLD
jgi:CRP/FNR family cyclic AMP-dependent transcriptional regulator